MPPLWSLGYQQSHRTLASRDEVLSIARTFREKKLPCDALIYLGTGFCPSGWNTGHGSFAFNPRFSPTPRRCSTSCTRCISTWCRTSSSVEVGERHGAAIRSTRAAPTKKARPATGTPIAASSPWASTAGGPTRATRSTRASRLARIRMYWEGCADRPARPPPLCPASQRLRRHAALRGIPLVGRCLFDLGRPCRTHVPIAINTGLTGIPYWGTDIGGFVPTRELTGELYVRWFQFGAFCPLFRSHGRTWKLRLPWGWNTGELGPNEIRTYGDAANPDPSELHNADVEPICRKYLELRYRLMPYLYSVVREGCQTGLPIMRALWLHHPDDPTARRSRRRVSSGARTSWSRP